MRLLSLETLARYTSVARNAPRPTPNSAIHQRGGSPCLQYPHASSRTVGDGICAIRPLAFLNGSWRGARLQRDLATGQSTIAATNEPPNGTKRLLELNLTHDSFHFQIIPGVVPEPGD